MRNSLIRQAAPDTFPHRWGKASGLAVQLSVSLYERAEAFLRFVETLREAFPHLWGKVSPLAVTDEGA